jgi:hypothetical protein
MTETYFSVPLKRCSRCKRWLPAKYPFFNHTKRKKSGLEYHCRGCRYGWTDDEFQVDVLRPALLEYFGNCCAVCGTPRRGQRVIAGDHWIPLSRGGPTTAENIIPLCHSLKGDIDGCNNTKRDRMPEIWLVERYGREKTREILKRIEAYFQWVKSQK